MRSLRTDNGASPTVTHDHRPVVTAKRRASHQVGTQILTKIQGILLTKLINR